MIFDDKTKVKLKGGGSLVTLRPKFSNSGNHIFVAWKNVIFCYNVKTGKRTNSFNDLSGRIVGFDLVYVNNCEILVACSDDGQVVIWKVENSLTARKKVFASFNNINSFHIISCKYVNSELSVQAVVTSIVDKTLSVSMIDTYTEKIENLFSIGITQKYNIDVSKEKKFIALTHKKRLTIIQCEGERNIKSHFCRKYFTALACHPEEECIITGDTLGRVLLWNSIYSNQPIQTVYHWHTLPVNALRFSSGGMQFFSGGNESVLVKWTIENPQNKKFLPRLPDTINHISIANDNLYIAISMKDNGIQIVDSRFQLVSVIQHLVISENLTAGIHYNPHFKSLVLNGLIGHVQFYSPEDSNLLYNLDVCGRNKLTQEQNHVILNIDVKKIAINKNGLWMATVEELNEISLCYETRLKFWHFDVSKQTWKLVTCVDFPHEDKILDIIFQPSPSDKDFKCVTCGKDKKFKIWQLMQEVTVYNQTFIWKCVTIGYYQDRVPSALAFSSDASLLAVSFDSILTTWTPDTCKLKCTLKHPIYSDVIEKMVFGVRNNCHLIIAATLKGVSVWNLLTLSMVWSVPINYKTLVTDPSTEHVALFTESNKLYIFTLNSSKPTYSEENLLKNTGEIVSAICVPNTFRNDGSGIWHQQSQLYFVNSHQELYGIDRIENYSEPLKLEMEDFDKSVFSNITPKNVISSVTEKPSVPLSHVYRGKQKALDVLLQSPIHTMVPPRLSCNSVLNSLLLVDKK